MTAINSGVEDRRAELSTVDRDIASVRPISGLRNGLYHDYSTGYKENFYAAKRRGILFGQFGLLLKQDAIYEIIEHVKLAPLPGVMPTFKGIVNHRGNIVPVYDLCEIFGIQAVSWERNRIIILNSGRESIAFALYQLPVQINPVVNVSVHEIKQVAEEILQHTRHVYRVDGILWFDFLEDSFFSYLRDSSLFDLQDHVSS